jgi:hypothetical protein
LNTRAVAYILVLILNSIIGITLYIAYALGTDPVTIPTMGVFSTPRDIVLLMMMATVLLTPWILANLIGTITTAEWLNSSRLWATIIAFIFLLALWTFKSSETFIVIDPALAYCVAEGLTTVVEKRKY